MNYYIKSTDEASLWEALETAGLAHKQYDHEDPLNTPSGEIDWVPTGVFKWVATCQLDIIGTIHVPTGETGEFEGRTFEFVEALEGFHANLLGQLTEEQQSALPLIDAPATPVRVWA
jgi:hypothetical protein